MTISSNSYTQGLATTVTDYLSLDTKVLSAAQLGNMSAVAAINQEISDVSDNLRSLSKQVSDEQTLITQATSRQSADQNTLATLQAQRDALAGKIAGETPVSSNTSTNTSSNTATLTGDKSQLATLNQQISSLTLTLQFEANYTTGLQDKLNDLQNQVTQATALLNNLQTQALQAAQQFDAQQRGQAQSSNSGDDTGGSTTQTYTGAQLTLASQLRQALLPGSNAASILDIPYNQESQPISSNSGT